MKTLNIFRRTLLTPSLFFPFSTDLQPTKNILKRNLYKIDLINKSVNRQILSMAYSPGVGAICEQVQSNFECADTMTMRGRSVAIVSDGSMLDSEGEQFMPVMDWMIAQIKYYSGVDAFPFVILKGADMNEILKDLSTCYGTVLLLDNQEVSEIPKDILLVRQR